MSAATLDRQRCLGGVFGEDTQSLAASASRVRSRSHTHPSQMEAHGGLTLDDLITGVWEGLAVRDSVRCPACGGTMMSRSTAGTDARHGECGDCGARLS